MKPISMLCVLLAAGAACELFAEVPAAQAVAASPQSDPGEQPSENPPPRYVGSRACMACHSSPEQGSQYVLWLRSRHGHAYWRLASDWALYLARLRPKYQDLENPRTDHRCLECHVTGARDDGASFADTFRAEEGVGCESCHGPGSDYADPDIMSDRESFLAHGGRVPDEATCRECHHRPENFSWDEWWPKIEHGRPESRAAASSPGTG